MTIYFTQGFQVIFLIWETGRTTDYYVWRGRE